MSNIIQKLTDRFPLIKNFKAESSIGLYRTVDIKFNDAISLVFYYRKKRDGTDIVCSAVLRGNKEAFNFNSYNFNYVTLNISGTLRNEERIFLAVDKFLNAWFSNSN